MAFCAFCQKTQQKKVLMKHKSAILGIFGVINGYSDKRIYTSVVEIPLVFVCMATVKT